MHSLTSRLVAAVDVDKQIERARLDNDLPPDVEPEPAQVEAATKKLCREALRPFASNVDLRNRLVEIRRETEQTIDTVSQDEVLFAGADPAAREKAADRDASFRQFIEDHRDEITALQVLYSRPYRDRLSLRDLKDLADAIKKPPLSATTQELWRAYEAVEGGDRKSATAKAADLVSLVRHAIDAAEPLTPFSDVVMRRYDRWSDDQRSAGATFSDEQWQWLGQIAVHIATSVRIEPNDFEYGWFADRGQLGKAHQLFGDRLTRLLDELNRELVA